MRVIAGSARGRRLLTPPGDRVRPTLDRVREALFSILAPQIPGARFLDLFAGSGANGIEALSRGAAEAVFVDDHPQSLACLEKNLETTGFKPQSRVLRYRLPEGLARIAGPFDCIFADPPHEFGHYPELLAAIDGARLLREGGTLIVEHARRHPLPDTAGQLARTRERDYGMTTLSFYA